MNEKPYSSQDDIAMPNNSADKNRLLKLNRGWKNYSIFAFIAIFIGFGAYIIITSLAATDTTTKTWSTAGEWADGTLSNVAIAGNTVVLASSSTAASPPAGATTPNGQVIANNSGSNIADSIGNKWTVTGGVVYKNGATAGYSARVTQIAYVNNAIWQENASNLWWAWTGTGWTSGNGTSTSPLTGSSTPGTSPGGTVAPLAFNNSGLAITDSAGNKWTVKNGVVYKNGATAGYSARVTEIAYVKNVIWQENSSQLWWAWTGSTWSNNGGTATSPLTGVITTTPSGTSSSYDSSGSMTLTFNANASVTWDTLTDQATTPNGTALTTEVRTSTNGSTWSAWATDVAKTAPSQYLQIEAKLATTNTAVTPELSSLALTYTPPQAATPTPVAAVPTPTPATPRPATPTPTVAPTPTPVTTTSTSPVGIAGNWTMKFDDEFNGTSLDTSKWSQGWGGTSLGVTGPNNSTEQECYDPSHVTEAGGELDLSLTKATETCPGKSGTVTEPYTSGAVSTDQKYTFTYGAAESRVWMSAGANGEIADWPAWWLVAPNWPAEGEIDTLEGLNGLPCYHYISDTTGPVFSGGCATLTSSATAGWHTYAVDWQPGNITFYYDGKETFHDTSDVSTFPMHLILNLALDPNQAPLYAPAKMRIDYVRVWQ